MFTRKFIGWSALALFAATVAILALQVLLIRFLPLNPQAALLTVGILALMAAILGFYAFTTSPGKVGAIGGLVLALAVACLLSVTFITRVGQSDVQSLSMATVTTSVVELSSLTDKKGDHHGQTLVESTQSPAAVAL